MMSLNLSLNPTIVKFSGWFKFANLPYTGSVAEAWLGMGNVPLINGSFEKLTKNTVNKRKPSLIPSSKRTKKYILQNERKIKQPSSVFMYNQPQQNLN